MNRLARTVTLASTLSLALLLSNCSSLDPTDIMDNLFATQKKPLPGERKPLFPQGTPGVQQGLPPELVKGYQPPPAIDATEEAQAAPEKPKPKPKPKPKDSKLNDDQIYSVGYWQAKDGEYAAALATLGTAANPADPRIQTIDVIADRVVELELAPLAQLHQGRRGKTLRLGGDAEAMARRQRRSGRQVGVTERALEDDFSALRDRDHAARLARQPQLECKPVRDVVECAREPAVHGVQLSVISFQ